MKRILIILICFITTNLTAQVYDYFTPEGFGSMTVELNDIPNGNYIFQESEIPKGEDSVFIAGVTELVDLDFFKLASKSISENNTEVYRYSITVHNALGVGVIFDDFYIPEGGKLFAYNADTSFVEGPYSASNNKKSRKYTIGPLSGQILVIEYNCPIGKGSAASLGISKIQKIYKPIFGDVSQPQAKSSNCFVDVQCETGLEVERSVIRWTHTDAQYIYYCSGCLINQDVPQDELIPYVLTAGHCGRGADLLTAKFYFNYQRPECEGSSGSLSYYVVGATEISSSISYDMFLLELDNTPPPDFNVHYAGWDRSDKGDLPDDMLGIHHPGGDEKVVSLGTLKSNTNPLFWRVSYDRNHSPTVPGSSGSPLFEDYSDRVIGWDSYGFSDCVDTDRISSYGKLRGAWGSLFPSTRLKDWLDPDDNNENSISGTDPCFTNLIVTNRAMYSAEDRYQTENKVAIQAGSTIVTSGFVIIKQDAYFKFAAGDGITLNSGFQVESGAIFEAVIQDCAQLAQ